tara:strand:- start:332 stop:481 length:150 start_codon:yes stop_codon:yes gene_type:complete
MIVSNLVPNGGKQKQNHPNFDNISYSFFMVFKGRQGFENANANLLNWIK